MINQYVRYNYWKTVNREKKIIKNIDIVTLNHEDNDRSNLNSFMAPSIIGRDIIV